ncbi:hexokinase [Anaeroselena agilis]|uniref:Hexokinase n=1 Tax=Anaeroselena agilis TaxID=3063788 RepID=A0ABU3P373_9FIRM|nr:hexokinase [Selenomonadales bacterium 4137-cl]
MHIPADTLERIERELTLTPAREEAIVADFRAAMAAGLAGEPSTLRMLPSHLGKPCGDERGLFLALDFGGSNVRVQLVELCGGGRWLVRRQTAAPLKDPAGAYDHTSAAATGEQLFDFLAAQIASLVDGGADYLLGHTFSFPCRQLDLGHAVLLGWTKEIKTAGVEGREVNALLAAALARRGLAGVRPVAVINDTVGTLLAAAYRDPAADIAAICGTGHNTCYYDAARDLVINMESGNFAARPFTRWDDALDAASEHPGTQRLEKMVAGRYLGELVRLILAGLGDPVGQPYSLTTADLADWLANPGQAPSRRRLAALVAGRSARLVAATFRGVLAHIDPGRKTGHTIAVDGSLYEKMPGYAGALAAALGQAPVLVKDGSGVGAAVAAALAASRR